MLKLLLLGKHIFIVNEKLSIFTVLMVIIVTLYSQLLFLFRHSTGKFKDCLHSCADNTDMQFLNGIQINLLVALTFIIIFLFFQKIIVSEQSTTIQTHEYSEHFAYTFF